MKKLVVLTALWTAVVAHAAASPMIDQFNTGFIPPDGSFALVVNSSQSLAQSFTVGVTGTLVQIDLGLIKYVDFTTDVLFDLMPLSVFPAYDFSSSLYRHDHPFQRGSTGDDDDDVR